MKKITAISLAMLSSTAVFAAMPIDGGDPVTPEENNKAPFNSIVKVEFDGARCTGAVIADNSVITAGHCTAGQEPTSYTITTADGQTHEVTRVQTNYDNEGLGNSGDFGVLTTADNLNEPALEFTAKTQNELLASSEDLYDAGYGINLSADNKLLQNTNQNPKGDLLKGGAFMGKKLFTITPEQSGEILNYIANKYPRVATLFGGMQVNPSYEFATCSDTPTDHGDSGGAILVKEDGKYTIAGLTSWGTVLSSNSGALEEYRACLASKDSTTIVDNSFSLNVFADMTTDSNNKQELAQFLAS